MRRDLKPCPTRCGEAIETRRVMCRWCWERVPPPLQKTVWRLWREGNPQSGFDEALASAVDQSNGGRR